MQSCDETLEKRSGSCRDSAWLLVNILRRMGLAARFVSGYIIQLKADVKPLEGPAGAAEDFTDLHAWAEVFLPGAGWIGLDPTSGLLAGEGHIPLACTPEPISAAPITGTASQRAERFRFPDDSHADPRGSARHQAVHRRAVGRDQRGSASKSTTTFAPATCGSRWAASRRSSRSTTWKAPSGRRPPWGRTSAGWPATCSRGSSTASPPAACCTWARASGIPANRCRAGRCDATGGSTASRSGRTNRCSPIRPKRGQHTVDDARRFGRLLAEKLGVNPQHVIDGYEDALYYTWKERRLPTNVDVRDSKLENEEERARIARVFEQGITSPVGCVLPLRRVWWAAEPYWESGEWVVRSDEMFLIPGDSPMGFRLPIQSLLWYERSELDAAGYARDAFAERPALPLYHQLRERAAQPRDEHRAAVSCRRRSARRRHLAATSMLARRLWRSASTTATTWRSAERYRHERRRPRYASPASRGGSSAATGSPDPDDPAGVVRTALCIEPRDGVLHVFMPPIDQLEDYLGAGRRRSKPRPPSLPRRS